MSTTDIRKDLMKAGVAERTAELLSRRFPFPGLATSLNILAAVVVFGLAFIMYTGQSLRSDIHSSLVENRATMDARFISLEERVYGLHVRISDTNERIADTNQRIADTNDRLEARFDAMNRRMDAQDAEIAELQAQVAELQAQNAEILAILRDMSQAERQ